MKIRDATDAGLYAIPTEVEILEVFIVMADIPSLSIG
jgi:hypothetical protein